MSYLCIDLETIPQERYADPGWVREHVEFDGDWQEEIGKIAYEASPTTLEDEAVGDGRAVFAATSVCAALNWTTARIAAVNAAWFAFEDEGLTKETVESGVYHLGNIGELGQGDLLEDEWELAERRLVEYALGLVTKALRNRWVIVTFNGTEFDLPMLRGRGIALGLTPPITINWKKLLYPWRHEPHTDLRIVLGGEKLHQRGTFEWYAKTLGIEASSEGGDVWGWVREGRWDEVERYGLGEGRGLASIYSKVRGWL